MGAVDSVERRHDYGSKVRSRHAGVSVDISKNAVGATYSVFPFVVNHCGFGLDFVATDGVADRACNVLITSSPGDLDLMTAPDGTCMLYRPDSLPETWATILECEKSHLFALAIAHSCRNKQQQWYERERSLFEPEDVLGVRVYVPTTLTDKMRAKREVV